MQIAWLTARARRRGRARHHPGFDGSQVLHRARQGNAESFETCSDEGVINETPGAYKDIDAVMAAQADLVEIAHTLRQVVCVKG